MSTLSSLGDHLQPLDYFAAHRVFTVATHHFIQIKIWKYEILISSEIFVHITCYKFIYLHTDFINLQKSTISAIPPLFTSLILNSLRLSKPNTSFCGTSAAVVVSTARMVISANDISVTRYNLSTTLIYLICVILSVIIITSVSTASSNMGMIYYLCST